MKEMSEPHLPCRTESGSLLTNAIANGLGFAAQLVVAFFVSPLLVHGLGDRRYGLWSLIDSILAYLMLFDLGVAASVVRYVARFEAIHDRDNRNRVLSTSLCIFAVAGALAFALAAGTAFGGARLLRLPADLAGEARVLLLLLGANLAVGLPLNVFPCVLDGLGRYPTKTVLRTANLVLRVPVLLAVLYLGGGLIELALATTACNLIEHLALALASWYYLPDLRFSVKLVDRVTFRLIRGYSLDAFLALVAGRITFQTDALVISACLAPQYITFFAIPARLVEYVKSALRAGTTVLTPAVSSLEAQGQVDAIRRMLVDGTRYVLWLILPIQIGLLLLGKPFLALWMGSRYAEAGYPVLAILAIPLALALSQSVAGRILYGTGRLRWFARATVLEALVNLLLSLCWIGPLGIEGVAWGTALPNLGFNLVVAVYICRTLEVRLAEYVRRAFLVPVATALFLAFLWLVILATAGFPTTWSSLLATGGLGVTGYFLVALGIEFGPGRLLRRLGVLVSPLTRILLWMRISHAFGPVCHRTPVARAEVSPEPAAAQLAPGPGLAGY